MRRHHSFVKLFSSVALALLVALFVLPARAHDIPGRITVFMYVKAEENRVLVAMRAPLEAFGEVQIPVRGQGFVDTTRLELPLRDAATMYVADGLHVLLADKSLGTPQLVGARIALPSDKAFAAIDTAIQAITSEPLDPKVDLYWKQAYFDALFEFPIPPELHEFRDRVALDANIARLSMETHTVLRYAPLTGAETAFEYSGYAGKIDLVPGRWNAFKRFVGLGFTHILEGTDHLLFIFCLVIPCLKFRSLIPLVTAFTLAHTITLIGSALNLVPTAPWFGPLIETLIAASIVVMACENIFGIGERSRWAIVFAFGLVHGFGFSFILAERMQFAGAHLFSGLLAFNVGVELGQLAALLVAVPLLGVLFRYASKVENGRKIAVIVLSAFAAHGAWHWFVDRGEKLLQFALGFPQLDAAFFASLTRWLMLLLVAGAAMWATGRALTHLSVTDGKAPHE